MHQLPGDCTVLAIIWCYCYITGIFLLLPHKDLLILSSSLLCEPSEWLYCFHASALSKSLTLLACTHWLRAVPYVPWHIQRAAGGQRAPSARWIHYIHKLIGGLSVFGLAVQHSLPAMFTEAMCQLITGSPHTSTLRCP